MGERLFDGWDDSSEAAAASMSRSSSAARGRVASIQCQCHRLVCARDLRLQGNYELIGQYDDPRGIRLHWYRHVVRPPRVPIFREHNRKLADNDLLLVFHSDLLQGEKLFDLAITIAAPGFADTVYWAARSRGPVLTLYPPTHHFTKARKG